MFFDDKIITDKQTRLVKFHMIAIGQKFFENSEFMVVGYVEDFLRCPHKFGAIFLKILTLPNFCGLLRTYILLD